MESPAACATKPVGRTTNGTSRTLARQLAWTRSASGARTPGCGNRGRNIPTCGLPHWDTQCWRGLAGSVFVTQRERGAGAVDREAPPSLVGHSRLQQSPDRQVGQKVAVPQLRPRRPAPSEQSPLRIRPALQSDLVVQRTLGPMEITRQRFGRKSQILRGVQFIMPRTPSFILRKHQWTAIPIALCVTNIWLL